MITTYQCLIVIHNQYQRYEKSAKFTNIRDMKKSAKFTNIRGMKKVQNSPISEV
jgi:hypothetical protein